MLKLSVMYKLNMLKIATCHRSVRKHISDHWYILKIQWKCDSDTDWYLFRNIQEYNLEYNSLISFYVTSNFYYII